MQIPLKIKIGTRGSALALKQANMVQEKLAALYPEIALEIITIITSGDRILDRNLAEIGGKGLFIKEIEQSLQAGEIDLAVHSLKDMPAIMPDIFEIPCVLERADVRDAFISHKYQTINQLPQGAVLGTSSARRGAQVLALRPDLRLIPLRGNIHTRLKKLASNTVDATFLAMAGLNRAGLMDGRAMHPISISEMLPAVSQGAIGIEILKHNHNMREIIAPLNHPITNICTNAERAFMRVFEGSCTTPIAALAQCVGETISLQCLIARPDGSRIHRTGGLGNLNDAENIGHDCAMQLKKLAGENFFA